MPIIDLYENPFDYDTADWLLTGKDRPYVDEAQGAPPKPSNVVEFQHMELVKGFQRKEQAKKINAYLFKLERLNPEAFEKVDSYIEGVVEGLQMAAEPTPEYGPDRRG